MNLKEYLFVYEMTVKKLADEIGYTRNWLSLLANGRQKPGSHIMKALTKYTDGQVTPEDIMNFYNEKQKKLAEKAKANAKK